MGLEVVVVVVGVGDEVRRCVFVVVGRWRLGVVVFVVDEIDVFDLGLDGVVGGVLDCNYVFYWGCW